MISVDRLPGARAVATPLDRLLDIHRVRQYFNAVLRAGQVGEAVLRDMAFLDVVRRTLLPLPTDPRRQPVNPFPAEVRTGPVSPLPPGRLAVVASGGSGATACLVGVAQALAEAGRRPDVYSLCSGSAMFGFPLAAGLSPGEVADLLLGLRPRDCADLAWRRLLTLPVNRGRGFTGLLRGDLFESYFRRHLGDRTLADLRTPAYAPIWSVEHNRVEYLGPRTHPGMPVAQAIRMAISMPLFFAPVELDGEHWCDGGIVDILPVRPVLDLEPPCQTAIAVNVFYPAGLSGQDATGWCDRSWSILRAASQVRTSQHIALARENLSRLRAACRTVLIEPVPYQAVQGTGFYRQFIDTTDWPGYMSAGLDATRNAFGPGSASPSRRAEQRIG
jgi:NTE family protein